MIRTIFAFTLAFLIPSFCLAQQSPIGTYKLVSFELLVDGQPFVTAAGPNPRGHLVVTPKLYLQAFTAVSRKFGTSVAEKAALWDTLGFWGGPYQMDGDKIVVAVDVSWNESWSGTKQTQTIKQDGKRLLLTSPPIPFPRDPSKTVVSNLVWEKID